MTTEPEPSWYYVLGGKRQGPASAAEMPGLVETRTITSETLVWTNGMPEWLPAAETRLSRLFQDTPDVLTTYQNADADDLAAELAYAGEFLRVMEEVPPADRAHLYRHILVRESFPELE